MLKLRKNNVLLNIMNMKVMIGLHTGDFDTHLMDIISCKDFLFSDILLSRSMLAELGGDNSFI